MDLGEEEVVEGLRGGIRGGCDRDVLYERKIKENNVSQKKVKVPQSR